MEKRYLYLLLPLLFLGIFCCSQQGAEEAKILARINDYTLTLNDFESQLTVELELDKDFKFGNGRQRYLMAQLLNKNGQSRAALNLLANLHVDFPGYDGIPDAYLLVAKILCESFNEDKKASQILEFLQDRYPTHPRISQVKDYMRIITGLSRH